MTNLTTPFELINPLDFDAVIDGLQKENSAFRSANETLLKTSLNQEKENVDLKVRLKNCLNHDSLIGTRSELNKKDGQTIDLQNSRKELKDENTRLLVLAIKHCPIEHHDFNELKKISVK